MRSSTSSSSNALRRAAAALILSVALICVIAELSTVYIMDRYSLTQIRVNSQLPLVLKLQQHNPTSQSVLIVGNSLLVHGLQTDVLSSDLGPSYVTAPLLIESTSYYDWFYGLHRLFQEQSRPDLVIIGLSVNNLLETRVRGEYFTQTLLDRHDLFKVASDIGSSNTETSSMFFGTVSRFWGDRSVIRNRVLGTALPNIQMLITALTRHPRIDVSEERATEQLRPRLFALKQLCEQNGTRLVLLLPPVAERADNSGTAFRLGSELGIPVLQPVRSDSLQPADFFDGVHLTPEVALRFTHAAAGSIRSSFPPPANASSFQTGK